MVVYGIKAVQHTVRQIRAGAVSGQAMKTNMKAITAGKYRSWLRRNLSGLYIPFYVGCNTGINGKLHGLKDRKSVV